MHASPAQAGAQFRAGLRRKAGTRPGDPEGDRHLDQVAFVSIMASRRNGTIYTGSTRHLARRAWEHRNGVVEGFTREHGCVLLVWYEHHPSVASARTRERQMKDWKRAWKLREIEGLNPDWDDLYERIAQG